MSEENNDNIILNAQQVSEYLRISLSTVHQLTRHQKLKSVKVGKQWRYLKKDIDRYLECGFEPAKEPAVYRGAERRSAPRIKCLIQGFAVLTYNDREAWEGDGNVLNVSEGGMLFESLENLPVPNPEAEVRVKVLLNPDDREEVELRGRVRHFRQDARTTLGIQFVDPQPALTASVEKLLSRN
jgi:excisionase family DNA binding protein